MNAPAKAREDADRTLARLGKLARTTGDGTVDTHTHDEGRDRLVAALAGSRRAQTPARPRAWMALAACVALAGGIVASVALRSPPRIAYAVEGATVSESGYVQAPPSEGAKVRFTEGTVVAFAPGGRGRVAEVGSHGARVVVESGRADVDVVHLPGAAWSVEAGPFVIAVIGTSFSVSWSTESDTLDVRLYRGAITVRGPLSQEGIALHAGERLVVRPAAGELRIDKATSAVDRPAGSASAAASAAPVPLASDTPSAAASAPAAVPHVVTSSAPAAPLSWSKRVGAGDFKGVLDDAEARGLDASLNQSSLADLAALADAARYAGRTDVARRALLAQRSRFAGTAEARDAAFLLGRIADDSLGRPSEAIGLYDAYLAEAPHGAFAAEALGRKMMATKRTQGIEAARAVAAEYLLRFPKGAHAKTAQELASPQ